MFRGEHYHSVDDKGRVIIPLRFRNELGTTFVITKGIGKCLFVFREKDFIALEEKLLAQPSLDQHTLRLKRFFSAGSLETQVDSQGRVAIPSNLRDFASIQEEVAIVGATDKIEIWSKARWDELNEEVTDEEIQLSAQEVGLGK